MDVNRRQTPRAAPQGLVPEISDFIPRFRLTYRRDIMLSEMINLSTITCPNCGTSKEEEMPTDSCIFFYECTNCLSLLKPRTGDCCVFCSYGSVDCPPKTGGAGCC